MKNKATLMMLIGALVNVGMAQGGDQRIGILYKTEVNYGL